MNAVVDAVTGVVSSPFSHTDYCRYYLYGAITLGLVAKRGSYLVTCLLSVERLYAVVRPLHVKQFLLSRFPVVCVGLAYGLSALWHVYLPTRTVVDTVRHPVTGHVFCRWGKEWGGGGRGGTDGVLNWPLYA